MEADRYAVTTLRSWRATDAGALALDLEGATALVAIAEDGSVRLRARAGAELPPAPEAAIGREPWRLVRAELRRRDGGGVSIAHGGPPRLGAGRRRRGWYRRANGGGGHKGPSHRGFAKDGRWRSEA